MMVEDSSGDGPSTSPDSSAAKGGPKNNTSRVSASDTPRGSRELAKSNKNDVRLLVHYAPPSPGPPSRSPSFPRVWWKDDTKHPSRNGRRGRAGRGWAIEDDDKRKEIAQVAGAAIFTLVAALALLATGAVAIANIGKRPSVLWYRLLEVHPSVVLLLLIALPALILLWRLPVRETLSPEEELSRDKRAVVWISMLEILAAGTLLLTTVHVVCLPKLSSFSSDTVPSKSFLQNDGSSPDEISFVSLFSTVSGVDGPSLAGNDDGSRRYNMMTPTAGGEYPFVETTRQHAVGSHVSWGKLFDFLDFKGNKRLQGPLKTGVSLTDDKPRTDKTGNEERASADVSTLMRGLFYWYRKRFSDQQRALGVASLISGRRTGSPTMLIPKGELGRTSQGSVHSSRRRNRTKTRESRNRHAGVALLQEPHPDSSHAVSSLIETVAGAGRGLESEGKGNYRIPVARGSSEYKRMQSALTDRRLVRDSLSDLTVRAKDTHPILETSTFHHALSSKTHLGRDGPGVSGIEKEPFSFIEDQAQPQDSGHEGQQDFPSAATTVSRRDALHNWLVVLKFTIFVGAVSCVIFAIAGTILVRANRKLKSGATGRFIACCSVTSLSGFLAAVLPLLDLARQPGPRSFEYRRLPFTEVTPAVLAGYLFVDGIISIILARMEERRSSEGVGSAATCHTPHLGLPSSALPSGSCSQPGTSTTPASVFS